MISNQLISNEEALRLFFNDDVYLVNEIEVAKVASEVVAVKTTSVAPNEIKEPSIPVAKVVSEPEVIYPTTINFNHLGKNEKHILILVDDGENAVSTLRGVELLRKLLLSINLKNADFALVNYSAYAAADFEQLNAFFSCKLLLSFGISPAKLGLADQNLHQLNMLNEIKMIFTHNLHDLETDIPSKRKLWSTLKNL